MTDLTNIEIDQAYGDYLTTTNNGGGLTTTLANLQDGLGNNSTVEIATNAINFSRTSGNTFQLDDVALTASATALNNVAEGTFDDPVSFGGGVQIGPGGDAPFLNIQSGMAQRVTLLDQGDSPYSAQDTDNIIALDDPFTMDDTFDVVLPDPTAIVTGRILSVKDQTGSLTVNRKIVVTSNGGALIDGNASLDLTNPYLSYTFYTDHANWYTLSAN